MRVSAVRQRAIEKAQPATHELSGCRKEGRGMDDRSLLLEDVEELYPPEHPVDLPRIERAIREILHAIGEDPDREGLKDTPARVARAYEFLFAGLGVDPIRQLTVGFQEDHHEMVLIRDIPFYSTCEHHLLPMIGKAHVGYIPDGKVVGLSKLARVVEGYSRRPQLQERLTAEVADALHHGLEAKGAIVVVEADHLCMTVRGVQKPGSVTVTSAVRGIYARDQRTRHEAMSLITGHR
jgi:GTP cyclohydrolase I